jgi:hypothetical protein
MRKLIRFWRNNKLAVLVSVFGLFWCIVTAVVILTYTALIQNNGKILFDFSIPVAIDCNLLFQLFDYVSVFLKYSQTYDFNYLYKYMYLEYIRRVYPVTQECANNVKETPNLCNASAKSNNTVSKRTKIFYSK